MENKTKALLCKKSIAACVLLSIHGVALSSSSKLEDLPLDALVDVASLEDLANMVITDTKTAQSRDTVTQNIVVQLREDMDRLPAGNRNISELMRHVSGQFVNVLSRNDANWGSYAGLGPKYNSYLLDGLPVDSFVDTMSLDPWALERIEAHKGPASVLYSNFLTMDFAGNEAPLAGTTNLILKERIEETMTRVEAGYGSNDTVSTRAYHQGRVDNLSYFAGAGTEDSRYEQYGADKSWLQTVEDPDYRKSKLYGKLSYAFDRTDHTLSLFAHHTRHDGDMGRPNRDFDHRYDLLNLHYTNQLSDSLNLQFKAGERRYERQFDNDNYPASLDLLSISETRQRLRPMDLTLNLRHRGNALLTLGVDHQTVDYRTGNSSNDVHARENRVDGRSTGFYLQEKVQLDNWVLRAGIRRNTIKHDYDLLGSQAPSVSGAEWRENLWSIGARYNISPTLAVYTNAGSSFMAPAAKQIGGTITNIAADSGQIANPGLDVENGTGTDFGVEWQPAPDLSFGARAFRNRISRAIVDTVVSAVPSQAIAINAANLTATGIELDIRHNPTGNLGWFANLTASRTRIEDPGNSDQDGSRIPFAPDRVANLGLMIYWPQSVRISAYYHWVGEYFDSTSRSAQMRLGSIGIVNMRLEKALPPIGDYSASLFVDINNLTDRRHDLPFGFIDPGINGMAGVDFRF